MQGNDPTTIAEIITSPWVVSAIKNKGRAMPTDGLSLKGIVYAYKKKTKTNTDITKTVSV